jgi:hypothetical protein
VSLQIRTDLTRGLSGSEAPGYTTGRLWTFIVGLLLPIAAVSDTGAIERVEGYYSAPSRICPHSANNNSKPCDMSDTDCLQIKKIDDRHARFDVYSVQVTKVR